MPGPMMGAGAMAGGGGMPPAAGGPSAGGGAAPITTAAPGNTMTTDVSKVADALKQILPQCIDDKGYVDMNRLITLWPQFSQIPFDVVMQLIEQAPDMLDQLITQYGLAGINVNGKIISADELHALGSQGGV